MGNWRTVNLVGTLSTEDAKKVHDYLELNYQHNDWNCLHNGGIYGLPNWGETIIDCVGNLAERNYDAEDILEELEKIAIFAPSLSIIVHCGGNYESNECVSSIVFNQGKGEIVEPLIDKIGEIPSSQIGDNFKKQLNY
jgi:hypothetical protein